MKKFSRILAVLLVLILLASINLPVRASGEIHAERHALSGFEDLSDEQFEALWEADEESLFMLLTNIRSLGVTIDAEHAPAKGKALKITAWPGSYFTLSSAGEVTGLPNIDNFYGFDGISLWLDTTENINQSGKLDLTLSYDGGEVKYEAAARGVEFHGGVQSVIEIPFDALEHGVEGDFSLEKINSLTLRFHSLGSSGSIYYLSDFGLYRDGEIKTDKLERAKALIEEFLAAIVPSEYSRQSVEEATGRFLELCEEFDDPQLTGTQLRVNQLTGEFLNIPSLLRPVDLRQSLIELIALCAQVDTSAYSTTSVYRFTQALSAAELAIENGEIDSDILRHLYNELEQAWRGLEAEELYTAGLELLIRQCEDYRSENYSHNSWTILTECLNSAKELLKGNPTQEEINWAEMALLDAMDRLVPVAALDYTAIEAAIARATTLNAQDYTPESFAFMQSMKRAAELEVISSERTQASLILCADNLNDAIDALVQVYINKEALAAAIARVQALNAGDYTAESYNTLIERVNEVSAALYDPDAEQNEIDAAANEISGFINRLVKRGNIEKAELVALIKSAEELDPKDYESSSFKAFEKALDSAWLTAGDEKSTANQIHLASAKLLDAWGKLRGYVYSPYITDFDYRNMRDFEGINIDKSVLKVTSQVPFDGTRGLLVLFDVGNEDILTLSPSGSNLREYPDIRGYEGIEYYADTSNAEGLYAMSMQLSVVDENGESVYTVESGAESGDGYTRMNFPLGKAEVSGSNAHDLYDYNRIGIGVGASCGELEVTALRAYRMSMAKLPAPGRATGADVTTTTSSNVLEKIAAIAKNPKTGDIGLGAIMSMLLVSVIVVLYRVKKNGLKLIK
ncbi:MAG TPA: hypothetical protein DEQ02_00970 [Ruminococcaceae bacterium]|nr:hypothetical protein [Oscillospiraceae bacterium]